MSVVWTESESALAGAARSTSLQHVAREGQWGTGSCNVSRTLKGINRALIKNIIGILELKVMFCV